MIRLIDDCFREDAPEDERWKLKLSAKKRKRLDLVLGQYTQVTFIEGADMARRFGARLAASTIDAVVGGP